jgi:hypothetical protein
MTAEKNRQILAGPIAVMTMIKWQQSASNREGLHPSQSRSSMAISAIATGE